jgi:hypothetical protein
VVNPYGERVSQSVEEPVTDHNDEPDDRPDDGPDEWPIAHLGRSGDDDGAADDADAERARPAHLRAIVIAALAVVVIGLLVGILVFNASAPPLGRGAESAGVAADRYVRAIDAGDEPAAAKISCDSFTDDARAQARTGADKGISFRMGKVHQVSKTDAVVVVTETLTLPGGHTHSSPTTLAITESGGRWLMCGRSG